MKESRTDAFEIRSISEPQKLSNNAVIINSGSDRLRFDSEVVKFNKPDV